MNELVVTKRNAAEITLPKGIILFVGVTTTNQKHLRLNRAAWGICAAVESSVNWPNTWPSTETSESIREGIVAPAVQLSTRLKLSEPVGDLEFNWSDSRYQGRKAAQKFVLE